MNKRMRKITHSAPFPYRAKRLIPPRSLIMLKGQRRCHLKQQEGKIYPNVIKITQSPERGSLISFPYELYEFQKGQDINRSGGANK